MNKILKILSILVIGFVMFSCSTPTNDPVEETPEEPTYSITFIAENPEQEKFEDFLNSLPNYKNLKKGTKVELLTSIYETKDDKLTLNDTSIVYKVSYKDTEISVVVNENITIKFNV